MTARNGATSALSLSTYALATIGLVLSLYAVYVERKVERLNEHRSDNAGEEEPAEIEEFTALCDIEAIGASCR